MKLSALSTQAYYASRDRLTPILTYIDKHTDIPFEALFTYRVREDNIMHVNLRQHIIRQIQKDLYDQAQDNNNRSY